MEFHGYCKNLKGTADALLEHKLFPFTFNPLNPTGILIIRKAVEASTSPAHTLACPQFKTPLERMDNGLFSPEALVVYPIVGGIPCLLIENGIIASKYPEFISI